MYMTDRFALLDHNGEISTTELGIVMRSLGRILPAWNLRYINSH